MFTAQEVDQVVKKKLEEQGVLIYPTSGIKQVNPNDVVRILGEKLISSVLIEEGTGVELMRNALDLADLRVTPVGKDFKFTGYPRYIDNE